MASSFLPGHLDTREFTMASDHQTQAGKPQPLNPKVGTLLEGGALCTLTPRGLSLSQLNTPWGRFPVPLCT